MCKVSKGQQIDSHTWNRKAYQENGPSRSPPIHPDRRHNMHSNGLADEDHRPSNLAPLSPPPQSHSHPRSVPFAKRDAASVTDEMKSQSLTPLLQCCSSVRQHLPLSSIAHVSRPYPCRFRSDLSPIHLARVLITARENRKETL